MQCRIRAHVVAGLLCVAAVAACTPPTSPPTPSPTDRTVTPTPRAGATKLPTLPDSTDPADFSDVVAAYELFISTSDRALRREDGGLMQGVSDTGTAGDRVVLGLSVLIHTGLRAVGRRTPHPYRVLVRSPRRVVLLDCLVDDLHILEKGEPRPGPELVSARAVIIWTDGRWLVRGFDRNELPGSRNPRRPVPDECRRFTP